MSVYLNGDESHCVFTLQMPFNTQAEGVPYTVAIWFKRDLGYAGLASCWSITDTAESNDVVRLNNLDPDGASGSAIRTTSRNQGASQTSKEVLDSSGAEVKFNPDQWNHAGGVFRSTEIHFPVNNGQPGLDDALATRNADDFNRMTLGAKISGSVDNITQGYIAEFGMWTVELKEWELRALAAGVRPSFIRPDSLISYLPMLKDFKDRGNRGREWIFNTVPVFGEPFGGFQSFHPFMKDPVQATYLVEQLTEQNKIDFEQRTTPDSTISDYRATRVTSWLAAANEQQSYSDKKTQFLFKNTNGQEGSFTITTNQNGVQGSAQNIFEATHKYVDIWLPPFSQYRVQTRIMVNGEWESWSNATIINAAGPLNSAQKYHALNAGTTTVPE